MSENIQTGDVVIVDGEKEGVVREIFPSGPVNVRFEEESWTHITDLSRIRVVEQ
jgi:hypothetical protein